LVRAPRRSALALHPRVSEPHRPPSPSGASRHLPINGEEAPTHEGGGGLPAHARCVVIGCGIVGNSLAYHLTRLGWRDIVLPDKGPLPNPGGSTGHASNFIYLVDHSKEMTALTMDSVRQYKELGVFIQSGGVEVARTKERMQELTRRMASAESWGIAPTSLVSAAQVKELVPYIEEPVILGGVYTPGVGVVDSLRPCTLMREDGQ